MAYDVQTRKDYAAWMATPPKWRIRYDLPRNKTEYAETHDITTRTLRRWERKDEFQEWVEEERTSWRVPEPNEQELEEYEQVTKEERDFNEITEVVVEQAKEGSLGFIKEYMKKLGKPLLQREQERLQSGLRELGDDELIDRMLTIIGREHVQRWLERHGDPQGDAE